MLSQQLIQKYRPTSFQDRLNQKLLGSQFDTFGMPRNTRYSHLGLMDVGFLGSVGAVPFSPLDVTGLKVWLDGDDPSTITKDGGDLVSQWDDKTSEGNDLSQATGSLQPLWIENGQNSRDIIRFDGIDNWIDRATFVGGGQSQPNTVFIACTFTTGNNTIFDTQAGGSERHLLQRSVNDHQLFAGATVNVGTVNTAFAQYNALYNTTSSQFRRNKTDVGGTISVGTNTFNGLIIGADTTPDSWSNIDVGEFLVYDNDVSDADRDKIETYLADRWNV